MAMKDGSRRWWIVLAIVGTTIVGMVLLAVAVGFWANSPASGPRLPVHYARDAKGQMQRLDEPKQRSGFPFKAHAGKIEAKNACSVATVKSHSGNSCFACRTVALFNLSDHPLMRSVGPLVADKLSELSYVDRIGYYPWDHRPTPGGAAPDLIVTLDVGPIQESGVLWRGLEADIRFTAGRHRVDSRHSYHDHTTPPLVQFHCRGRLSHQSTTTGVGPRYQLTAANIAEEIAKQLAKQLDECRKSYDPLPELPADFFPAYRQPPKLSFLEQRQAELLDGYHGLMTRNDSLWRIPIEGDPAAVVQMIKKELEEAGWKISSDSADAGKHLRAKQGTAILTVFVDDPIEQQLGPSQATVITLPDGTKKAVPVSASRPARLYVHYEERLSREEVCDAVERLMAEDAPLEMLRAFRPWWTRPVEQQILARLEASPAGAEDWLELAELRHRSKQNEKALEALRQAHLRISVLPNPGDLEQRLRNVAKELGQKEFPNTPPDPAALRGLGFVELKPGVATADRELKLGEMACFFGIDGQGQVKTITLRVVSANVKGGPPYQLEYGERQPGTRSHGTGGMQYMAQIDGTCRATFRVKPAEGKDRFRLSVETSTASQK